MSAAVEVARQKAWRSRYMAGWDACIAGRPVNPYQREDYRRTWAIGFARCEQGLTLPPWYPEWVEGRRRPAVD